MVHSVLASLVHSLCTSAADPLSDLEGVRRAATGECDVVGWLVVLVLNLAIYPASPTQGRVGLTDRLTHSAQTQYNLTR